MRVFQQAVATVGLGLALISTGAVAQQQFVNVLTGGQSGVYYPVGVEITVNQTVSIQNLATLTKILFNKVDFDPDLVYNTANSQYIAPVNGIYLVSAELQVDNNTGTAASMEMALSIRKNGAIYTGSGASVASPPGARWYPQVSALVQLGVGDQVDIALALDDTVRTGNVTVGANNSTASFVLVRRL
jgi:hypothetical protein